MNPLRRQGRTLFLGYLCAAWVAVLMAVPLAGLFGSASAGASMRAPTFARVDRNHDGYVDRLESAAVRGLVTRFSEADMNGDGKLDQVEFAQALGLVDTKTTERTK
jgi:hypothetical protein